MLIIKNEIIGEEKKFLSEPHQKIIIKKSRDVSEHTRPVEEIKVKNIYLPYFSS